jgi:hypothetical protein
MGIPMATGARGFYACTPGRVYRRRAPPVDGTLLTTVFKTAAPVNLFSQSNIVTHAATNLQDAVKTGWARPSELKEPDFDALRSRADFQKLVAEVQAKAEKSPATAPRRGEKK